MGVGQRIAEYFGFEQEQRFTFQDWVSVLSYQNHAYQLTGSGSLDSKQEAISPDYRGFAQTFKANGAVFSCITARQQLFSEAKFKFKNSRTGELFGTTALAPLEAPWSGGTTGDLLTKAILDVDLAGNAFFTPYQRGIKRLRPDWMTIVLGGEEGIDYNAQLLGYLYQPGGPAKGLEPVVLRPEQVAHFAPIPDPDASYRGMSWLTPVIQDIMGDKAMASHKLRFFEQGATPNVIVKLDPAVQLEAAKRWIELFKADNEGVENAYKTMFLGGGADATVVGANMRQVDFTATQSAGEVRIAAAARVPAIIAGFSEGLDSATYSNFGQARRVFADGTIRPLWRNLCGSLQNIVNTPSGAELWYDDTDIPFVQEDRKDDAEIKQVQASTVNSLITAGYDADSAVQAVITGDFRKLKHTGLFSVQLQPPGSNQPDPTTNGVVPPDVPVAPPAP